MGLKTKYDLLLKKNQRRTGSFFYTVPSSKVYPFQWLWDSCFHSIIYTHFNLDNAKSEIISLLNGQWKNGMLPHILFWEQKRLPNSIHNIGFRTKETSSITQPPLIAYSVEQIYKKSNDSAFVKKIFNKIHKYYVWLHLNRAVKYIPVIIHPWESGLDDFPLWDFVYGLKNPSKEQLIKNKKQLLNEYLNYLNISQKSNNTKTNAKPSKQYLKKSKFAVKSLLFNSIYLRSLYSMLFLAKQLKLRQYSYYSNLIPKVEKQFKLQFFNKKKNIFISLNKKRQFTDMLSFEIFMPLFAGIATQNQADYAVSFLVDKTKFWLKNPVPVLPLCSPYFHPEKYWRGTTWININWFIIKGLQNYGYDAIAKKIKQKSISLVKKTGFYEYFSPLEYKGFGPNDFTWSGLIFDM